MKLSTSNKNKLARFILLTSCFCLLNSSVFALDQFLDMCLQIAKARDKRIALAEEQENLAKMRITKTIRNFFPSLSAQRKFSRGKTITDEYEAEEFGLRAMQPIFEGGRQISLYKYDKLGEELARYNYTKTKEELFYKIKLSYYELLSLNMELKALNKAFKEIDELEKKVKIEYDAKAISELDVLEAQNFRDKVANLFESSKLNLILATDKLAKAVNITSLDNIPVLMPETMSEDVPEIQFTYDECKGFLEVGNLDVKITELQILMAKLKIKVNRSKVTPKFYVEGFYGQSGEAYVTEPLQLATVWSIMGRLSWGLWGNSMEMVNLNEKTNPSEILDVSARIETSSYEMKLALLDDMNYFVDGRDAKLVFLQAQAELDEIQKKNDLQLTKVFNEYKNSMRNIRSLKKEIIFRERKLALLRKRNDLYEVPTAQLMEEVSKYSESISSYARALYANYASVTELEKLTLMSLR